MMVNQDFISSQKRRFKTVLRQVKNCYLMISPVIDLVVTNLDLPLDQVWNIYNTRADRDNRIKELNEDFDLEKFCLKDFWATEASFRFIMVA